MIKLLSLDLGIFPSSRAHSHAWLFEGAEPGRLPALLAEMVADNEEKESDGGGDDENQQDDQDDEPLQTKAELPIA